MIRLPDEDPADLAALCWGYGLARSGPFGSAVREDFDPPQSDLHEECG